jgi:mxaL protein
MGRRPLNRGYRFWLPLLALVVLLFTYARPALPIKQNVYHYLFLIDITQSMNARDYHIEGMPADRLSVVKEALRRVLQDLPCGSRVGLGLFTTKNIMLLFEPLEVCRHFAVIDDVIAHVDWRMAWSADSNIERGLYTAIQKIKKLADQTRLVFLTDGEQTINELHRPPLAKVANTVQGLIVGVGELKPVPLPKLDQENRMIGYWQRSEVKRLDRRPPTDRAAMKQNDRIYRSQLHEAELQQLAGTLGLRYHRLVTVERFSEALRSTDMAEQRVVATDIRWLLGLSALILIVAAYFPDLMRKAPRSIVFFPNSKKNG